MKLLKACSIFILACFVSLPCLAQTRVTGYVTRASDGDPLGGTKIYHNDSGRSWTTDSTGYFEINGLPVGAQTLFFYKFEYHTLQQEVIVGEASTSLNVSLKKLEYASSGLTVEVGRDEHFTIARLREVEGTSIYAGKKTEIVRMDQLVANLATNNARQIYSRVAGLNIYGSANAGLQLNIGGRGLDPNRSANFNMRQNGYDISAEVLGYPESYYTPPAEALQEVQIVRGAASLQYGTQFGGLVNFILKEPERDQKFQLNSRQSAGSFNLLNTFNSISGTVGNFGYYTYFNYKQGDGFRPNSDYEAKNFYSHLAYDISPKTSMALELTRYHYLAQQPGGLTDAQFYDNPDFSNRTRNWFKVDWKLYALKLNHRFSNETKLNLDIFSLDASRKTVGFRTNRVSQVDDKDAPRDLILGNFNNAGAEVRLLHRYNTGKKRSVFLLGSKYYRSKNTAVQGPGSAESGPDFHLADDRFPYYPNQSDFEFPNLNVSVFGENIFYLSDRLSLTPGFRFEYIRTGSEGTYKRINFDLAGNPILNNTFHEDRTFDRNFVLFGLGASYIPVDGMEIYANFSQNYRSVTFNDIRIVNPTYQVDPNISDEKGFTVDAGIRGTLGNLFSYDIGGFSLLYDNRIGEVLRAETRPDASGKLIETGRIVRYRGNIGKAFMYGFESLVEWNLGNLLLPNNRIQVRWFANTSLTGSTYLDSEIAGVKGNKVEFIPLLNLKTGFNFGYKNFSASLLYTRLSKQYTDASNAEQNVNDNQSGIKGAIPPYDVMDLSLSWTKHPFTIEMGINNVLNNDYFTRRATGYPGPGIIPSPPRSFYGTIQLKL